MYPFRHSNSWRSGRKGRTEKLVNVGEFFFHVVVDREIFTFVKNEK